MSDPRFTDEQRRSKMEPATGDSYEPVGEGQSLWGWIVGAALVVAAVALIIGYGMTGDDDTASSPPPPSATTTGSGGAMKPATPAPRPLTPAPTQK